jgi:hypothetical protein
MPWQIYPITIIQSLSGNLKIYDGPYIKLTSTEIKQENIIIDLFSIPLGILWMHMLVGI